MRILRPDFASSFKGTQTYVAAGDDVAPAPIAASNITHLTTGTQELASAAKFATRSETPAAGKSKSLIDTQIAEISARQKKGAQISDEQRQLAARTIMQFETEPLEAAQAVFDLLNMEDSKLFKGNQVKYTNHQSKVSVTVAPKEGGYQVSVSFPERAKAWVKFYSAADLPSLQLSKVVEAGNKMVAQASTKDWIKIPNDDGSMPTVPVASQILAADARKLLLDDGVLDIRIAYGYYDDKPNNDPTDRQMAVNLCKRLVRKNGFVRTEEDPFVLEKKFQYDGKEALCRVSMIHSAALKKEGEEAQSAQSLKARDFFMKALKEADVAMYDGHSRAGRGPDFTTKQDLWSPGNLRVGPVTPYIELKNGDLLRFPLPFTGGRDFKAPVFNQDKYQILVLDSCKSEAYYRERVMADAQKYSGKTAATLDIITADTDAEYSDSIPTKLRIILSLVEGKSAVEINHDLNTQSGTKYNTNGLFVSNDQDTRCDDDVIREKAKKGADADALAA